MTTANVLEMTRPTGGGEDGASAQVVCECGAYVGRSSLARHLRTADHAADAFTARAKRDGWTRAYGNDYVMARALGAPTCRSPQDSRGARDTYIRRWTHDVFAYSCPDACPTQGSPQEDAACAGCPLCGYAALGALVFRLARDPVAAQMLENDIARNRGDERIAALLREQARHEARVVLTPREGQDDAGRGPTEADLYTAAAGG